MPTLPSMGSSRATPSHTIKADPSKINEISVAPSQFVREQVADLLDYYTMGKRLGGGTYGEVFICIHKATQQIRAVKIMDKSAFDEEERNRFLGEVEILKIMDHPNIVKLYEVFQDKKKFYFVTDLCTGGELFEKMSKGVLLDEASSANYMKQVLSAIVYCHSNKVVHRDLKPENLLLESSDPHARVKVIDFGTSQIFNPEKKMTQKLGTPYYIAPEVLKLSYTEKCDIWSCGVILYIFLCGYPPFEGRSDYEIMGKIRKGVINMEGPKWENVSASAKDLVKKLLTVDPLKRCTAQESLNHPWIKQHCKQVFDKGLTTELLNNMRLFKTQHKLQEAALTYIVSQLVTSKEKLSIQNTFLYLDTNSDGRLSKDELVAAYKLLFEGKLNAEEEVTTILKRLDIDNNGYIDYTEFMLATISRKDILTPERLKLAFAMFDRDGSGAISAEEIKALLGVGITVPDEQWKAIIREVDLNGDGEISMDEFVAMMKKLLTD